MKSFKTTLLFSLVVVVVLGYSLYELKEKQGSDGLESSVEKVLPLLQNTELTSVNVVRSIKPFTLVHKNNVWVLQKPVEDKVDQLQLSEFLTKIKKQQAQVLQEGQDVDWDQYGLEKPAGQLNLKYMDGAEESVWISARKSYDKKSYIRVGQRLMLAEENWDDLVYKPLKDFRNKKILEVLEDPVRIMDRQEGKKVVLVKKDGEWKVEKYPGLKVDPQQVSHWLQKLKSWRASDFLSKRPSVSEPYRRLVLEYKNDKSVELKVDKPVNKGATLVSDATPFVYRIAESTVKTLPFGMGYFRDRKYPFVFDAHKAEELIYKNKSGEVHLIKKDKKWSLVSDKKGTVDVEQVQSLLDQVRKLSVKEFLKFKVKKNQQKSFIKIYGKNKEKVFELAWNPAFDSKGNMWVLKSSLSKETLGVAELKFKPLTEVKLLKEVPSKPKKNLKR